MKRRVLFVIVTLLIRFSALPVHAQDGLDRNARAEIRFLEGMIDHHQMALDMAQDCLNKASSDSLKELCQNVIDAQSAEITWMQGMLRDWYQIDYAPLPMAEMGGGAMHGMMDHQGDPQGMMGMMAGFNRFKGEAYDIAWLEAMIDHHDDALHMSERILPRAQHEELSALAQQIIDDQTAEIEMMEEMLTTY